jgi:cyclophilin family peptidyl-prolyl cis-trans isomerase
MKSLLPFLVFVTFSAHASKPVTVIMDTSMGKVEIELNEEKAPITVKNFLSYVDSKFYDGTIFHRVINGFMVQGGGFLPGLKEKGTKAPIKNEAANGLTNDTGTMAMARTSEPNSASSQFFINVANNSSLNYRGPGPSEIGYAVFGKITSGMHVINRIKTVRTGSLNGHSDVPMDPVMVKSIKRK